MTTNLGIRACAEEAGDGESEPSRTSTDVSVEDPRWAAVPGLIGLIPELVSEVLHRASRLHELRSVSIALLSDSAVAALNKAYRGKDNATNVLSFPSPARHIPGEPMLLGDVVLAFETVEREAASQDMPMVHHAAHLVVHGVLHLMGFEHGDDAAASRMEAAERAILERFGIPDPYADDARSINP